MKTRRYKKVFEGELSHFLPQSFVYVPEPKDEKLIGLLLTEGCSLSLSLKGGTSPILNQESPSTDLSAPPDHRLRTLHLPFNGKAMHGIVRIHSEYPLESSVGRVYFLIQQQQ